MKTSFRLDKYLADMSVGTRSEVKNLIKKGLVTVNGEVIRKPEYKVDIEKLKEILKVQKQKLGLTIKDISNTLNVNKTTVEHWFRSDDCFSIPDAEIWLPIPCRISLNS